MFTTTRLRAIRDEMQRQVEAWEAESQKHPAIVPSVLWVKDSLAAMTASIEKIDAFAKAMHDAESD